MKSFRGIKRENFAFPAFRNMKWDGVLGRCSSTVSEKVQFMLDLDAMVKFEIVEKTHEGRRPWLRWE